MSGPFAYQGEEQLKSFNAAIDLVNSQGGVLGGRRFELVVFDHKANPQRPLGWSVTLCVSGRARARRRRRARPSRSPDPRLADGTGAR